MTVLVVLAYGLLFFLVANSLRRLSFAKDDLSYLHQSLGFLLFSVFAIFNFEKIYIAFALLLALSTLYHDRKQILHDLRADKYIWIFLSFVFCIAYMDALKFWKIGPPGDYQDTIWNAGHIAYYKNNVPFFDQFTDVHINGNNFNYHFFGHFLYAKLSNVLGLSAISASVVMNFVVFAALVYTAYIYFKNNFKISPLLSAVTAGASFFVLGLTGVFNAYYDLAVNTLGLYYWKTNLTVTLAILFMCILFFQIINYLKFKEIFFESKAKSLKLICSFLVVNLFLVMTKAPYSVVFIAVLGIYSVLYFFRHSEETLYKRSFLFLMSSLATVLFLIVYLVYYSKTSGDRLSLEYAEIVQYALSKYSTYELGVFLKVLLTPIYLLLFYGFGLVLNVYFFVKHRKHKFVSEVALLGCLSILIGSFFLLFLKQSGQSQVYFGLAGLSLANLSAAVSFLYLAELKEFSKEKLKIFASVFTLCLLGYFFGPYTFLILSTLAVFVAFKFKFKRSLVFVCSAVFILLVSRKSITNYLELISEDHLKFLKILSTNFAQSQLVANWIAAFFTVLLLIAFIITLYQFFKKNRSDLYLKFSVVCVPLGLVLYLALLSIYSYYNYFNHPKAYYLLVSLNLSAAATGVYFAYNKFFKSAICFLSLFFVVAFSFHDVKKNSHNALIIREACLWIKNNSQTNDLVAINMHDDELGGEKRFFSCSALAERKFLIEGYAYISASEKNEGLVANLLKQNSSLFQEGIFQNVAYAVDVKGQIKNLQPVATFSGEDELEIKIFKNPAVN